MHGQPAAAGPPVRALLDEALKKSGLLWLTRADADRSHAFWHAWVDGRAYLLTGRGEQPDPHLDDGEQVLLLVRSRDDAHRLLVVETVAEPVGVDDADWQAATAALAAGRLNLPRAHEAPARWAADAAVVVYRLTPADVLLEGPGHYPDDDHRAAPPPTPATTVGRAPRVLHRRGHRGRPLS